MGKLKRILSTGALVAVLALSACGGNNNANTTPVPITPVQVPTTPAPTTTPAPVIPTPQSKYGVPKVSKEYPDVIYEHGDVFWRKDISGGIEQAVLKTVSGYLKTPEDFKGIGAVVDEKYEQVVAWGTVSGMPLHAPVSKVSFLDVKDGYERSGYWFYGGNNNKALIRDVAFAYDVNSKDYLIIAGSTGKNSIWNKLTDKFPFAKKTIPFIEVTERTPNGVIPIGHTHPVAILEGEAYGVKYDNSSGTLSFKTTSSAGTHKISLDRILSLENERPLFE